MRLASLATFSAFVLLILALTASPLRADEAVNPGLTGEYATMATDLKLNADQQAKLVDLAKQKDDAITQWETTNQAKLNELAEAAKSSDKAAAKQARKDRMTLMADKANVETTYDLKIQAILTPDQAQQWNATKLNKEMQARFKKAELTADQQDQVKTMAAATAGDIAKVSSPDAKTLDQLKKELAMNIHDKVLTDAQRKVMDSMMMRGGKGKAAAAPAEAPATAPAPSAIPMD